MLRMTAMELKKKYGPYYLEVLGNILDMIPRQRKRERLAFRIRKPLPSPDDFAKMMRERFTVTVDELISSALSELQSLGEEMDEWYNNLPESFQQSDKGDQLETARDTLQDLEEPDFGIFGDIKVYHLPQKDVGSRAKRCAAASSELESAIGALQEHKEELEERISQEKGNKEEMKQLEARMEALETLLEELQQIVDNADSVEFPTMYS